MRYMLNDLVVDTETRTVRNGKSAIKLSELSFETLISLIEVAPRALPNHEISERVWQVEHVSDETVSQRITLLRKALGDDPKNPTYIRTVRGKGYAIVGVIEPLEDGKSNGFDWLVSRPKHVAATVALVTCAIVGLFFVATPDLTQMRDAASESSISNSTSGILTERAKDQLGLHQSRETDRAIAMLREALAVEPDSFDARLTLSFSLSTKATKFDGDAPEEREAESIARDLLGEDPNSSQAWSALAYSLGAQGRMDESLPAYQRAYQLNPRNVSALSSAAYIHLLRGDLQQALMLEMEAKQAGGNSRYAEIQVFQVLELIEHPAAGKWREEALLLNPGQVVILGELARSHLREGNPRAALEMLEHAAGEDRFAPQLLQLRGRANLALGRVEDARQIFETAGWRGHYDLAALNALSGDNQLADTILNPEKRAEIESDPDPASRIQLAEIKSAQGETDEALRLLTQAVTLGWRDIGWLEHSPFLGTLMNSGRAREIETRIERELEAQRTLIAGTEELSQFISS